MTAAAGRHAHDEAPTRRAGRLLADEASRAGSRAARIVELSVFGATAWNGAPVERRTPMQQHIWTLAAARALSPSVPVRVMTVGLASAPLALAPLCVAGRWPRRLRLLGAEELAEPIEAIYADDRALEALTEGLAATRLPLSFGHHLADTSFLPALQRAFRGRGLVVARPLPQRACPSIALDESWLEPERHFNARRRSDFRRMQRAAEKLGKVTFEILSLGIRELPGLLEEAMAIEARGWKGRSGTALAHDEQQARFYRHYAGLAAEAGILRLCFMRIDGTAVAMQLAAETERRFWLFKIGYDEACKRCSPGNLLLRETIRYAAARGLVSYEFLGKEAGWTRLWTETARPVVALRAYPYNLSGALALAADAVHALRQHIAAWRPARAEAHAKGDADA